MFDVFFDAATLHHNISMRGSYLGFFPKRIKHMISWQPLFSFFYFRFLVFAQNRPQNNDDDVLEWWKGQKKIAVYNLGTFYLRVWAEPSHRFDEKQSTGNFFNKFVYAKFLRKRKVNEVMMQSLPSQLETKSWIVPKIQNDHFK